MKLIKWSYTKRYHIKALFEEFPNSPVIFRKILGYYFIYTVHWSPQDPVVSKVCLEKMEVALNKDLGSLFEYENRRQAKD